MKSHFTTKEWHTNKEREREENTDINIHASTHIQKYKSDDAELKFRSIIRKNK